jgi:hypothetical protein
MPQFLGWGSSSLEDALRVVCDDVFIDSLPNNVAALFIELAKRIDGDT